MRGASWGYHCAREKSNRIPVGSSCRTCVAPGLVPACPPPHSQRPRLAHQRHLFPFNSPLNLPPTSPHQHHHQQHHGNSLPQPSARSTLVPSARFSTVTSSSPTLSS